MFELFYYQNERPENISEILIYVFCTFLAMAYWLIFFSTNMRGFAKILYLIFLPFTSTPFIIWVIHREGQESEDYLKKWYGGSIGQM